MSDHSGGASPPPRARARSGLRGTAFRLLLVATVSAFSGYVLLLPVVPLWASEGGAGELGAGATTSVFMLTTVLTQLAMPWLLNHGGYRWTMSAGALLLGLPAPLLILWTDLVPLLAISAVRGVGFGMVTVVGSALAARLVEPDEIGRAAGYYGLAVGVPNLIWLSAGVWLAVNVSYPLVFWLAAIGPMVSVAAAVGIWLTAGDGTPATDPGAGEAAAADWPHGPRLWLVLLTPLLVMVAAAVASSAIVTFLPIALERASSVASLALLGYSAMLLVFRGAAGAISDRSGKTALLVPGTVVGAVGMALAAWSVWSAGTGWEGPGWVGVACALVGGALFGGGFGAVQNDTLVLMFRRSGPAGYGTASAAWNIGFDAGTGVGALSLGLLIQFFGYGPAFLSTALVLAACLPLVSALRRDGENRGLSRR